MKSYCNPVNMNYRFLQPGRGASEPCREGSDPAVIFFEGKYLLATSKTSGLHWSDDLVEWHFIPSKVLPAEGYGPDLFIKDDKLHYVNGLVDGGVFQAIDVFQDRWQVVGNVGHLPDPKIFAENNGRLFLYYGCDMLKPLIVVELDPVTYKPISKTISLNIPDPTRHGWDRSGENNEPRADVLTMLGIHHPDYSNYRPETWNEGAWMTQHNGMYYLQNSTPATEFNIYSDSISVGRNPLGPFEFQKDNPFSLKPGGFITGAGHSCSFEDRYGNLFHMSTMRISRHFVYERRIGLFPAGFYDDGTMFCRTRFGDYPHFVPNRKLHWSEDTFCGWMLQSYHCKIIASSEEAGYEVNFAVDDNIRTYWAANTSDPKPQLTVDLDVPSEIQALQINFAEHHCRNYADANPTGCARFIIETSDNGQNWQLLLDRSKNSEDKTHIYKVLDHPCFARYLRLTILAVANEGIPAISGFRVFGTAPIDIPQAVTDVIINRRRNDPMTADVSWKLPKSAYGVNVLWGLSPDHLHHCWQVLDEEKLVLPSLEASTNYYVAVEAFGRGGIARISDPILI
jgi:hypothetical protein